MFEESAGTIPSLWASMNSWFTPTVLFLLLNLMIGTIALTSTLSNPPQKQKQQPDKHTPQDQDPPKSPTLLLHRSPSVLHRLRSFNFYTHSSHHEQTPSSIPTQFFKPTPDSDTHFPPPQTLEAEFHPQFQQTLEPEPQLDPDQEEGGGGGDEVEDQRTMEEVYSQLPDRHVSRTKSDTEPSAGEIPARLPAKMRKSASSKSAFGHFEEADVVEVRRPATVREGKGKAMDGEDDDDEEVDAKADDFINKFKQQLKLQRLDSIIRYKEMITRGSGK